MCGREGEQAVRESGTGGESERETQGGLGAGEKQHASSLSRHRLFFVTTCNRPRHQGKYLDRTIKKTAKKKCTQ